jgi:hypothetical protein
MRPLATRSTFQVTRALPTVGAGHDGAIPALQAKAV